jgi:peptidoglycan/xylan/chitin deacetylase (PgdA/CDA1 family)
MRGWSQGGFGRDQLDAKLPSENRVLTQLKLELAYFGGGVLLASRERGGAGAVLSFEHVRARRDGRFQPARSREITPGFLGRAIRALRRWNYDIVSIDEACRRALTLAERRRFVALTFDGCAKDLITDGYPVLARDGVPFTIYVPTAFPDGLGQSWRLALETIIAKESRFALMIAGGERHFTVRAASEKYEAYEFLSEWMRSLSPADLSAAINDLCKRYSVDLAAISREASMNWSDLARLAADPNVTIGCATVNYPALSNLKDAAALREMTMGRAVLETALGRQIRHFAFPFGDRESFRRAHVVMAEEAGFVSAVSTIPGVVQPTGRTNPHALPRIAWDGRSESLRVMRVLLSGAAFKPVKPTPSAIQL